MTAGKRQHYISRFYLSRFAGPDGRVLVHRLGQPAIYIHTKNVGVETHYNSVPGENDAMDTSPEKVLTDYIDTPTSEVFRKMDSGQVLDPTDRLRLAIFMVFQYYRSPASKAAVKDYLAEQATEFLQNMDVDGVEMNEWVEDPEVDLSEEQIRQIPSLVARGEITVSATNAPWLDYAFAKTKQIAAQVVNRRCWSLCKAPRHFQFVTSDNPVQHYILGDSSNLDDVSVWLAPDAMTVFPLDPETCILAHHGRRNFMRALGSSHARDLNRVTVLGSHRMVFSRNRADFVQKILVKK